jgi:hypothetical protein
MLSECLITVHFSKLCYITKLITQLKYLKKQRSISKWHGSNNKSIEDKKRLETIELKNENVSLVSNSLLSASLPACEM